MTSGQHEKKNVDPAESDNTKATSVSEMNNESVDAAENSSKQAIKPTAKKGVARRLRPQAKEKKQADKAASKEKAESGIEEGPAERQQDGKTAQGRRQSSAVKKPKKGWTNPFIAK